MSSISILKSSFHNSVADSVYSEIASNSIGHYYYFLGKTIEWNNDFAPDVPVDNIAYDTLTRNEIITIKQISISDVAYVIPRYDWTSGVSYDAYDDRYSTEIQGIDLITPGSGYTLAPRIYIGGEGKLPWVANFGYSKGDMIYSNPNYYIVTGSGIAGSIAPNHTAGSIVNGTAMLAYISIVTGGGEGANAIASVRDVDFIDTITLTSKGVGYTSDPSITIAPITLLGSGCTATAKVSRVASIEAAKFYTITDELNVYKCLNNNNNGLSTIKPTGTDSQILKTSDGYTWKFLYFIPPSMRKKFLTPANMPVVNALQNQFYANGELQIVKVDARGSGYVSANIIVQGNGFLEANPVYLIGYNIVSGGTGYTSPILTVAAPWTGVVTWAASASYIVGVKLSFDKNIYSVDVAGVAGTVGPTHKFGVVSNGSTQLKYIGTIPTATASSTGGVITEVTLQGEVSEITVSNRGSGYISTPSISFTGTGSEATALAIMDSGSVSFIRTIETGKNFTSAPTVNIGNSWEASLVVMVQTQYREGGRLYTVTGAGTFGVSAPIHASGSATNGTATLTYAGVAASATCQVIFGAGYSSAPVITVTGGIDAVIAFNTIKTDARLVPIIELGAITGVITIDGGIGYTYANISIVGDGTGALASTDLSVGNINSLQSNVELQTIDGALSYIPVMSGGYGYTTASVALTGDGSGGLATASIVNGRITKINIISAGVNYRWCNIAITGDGFGANARVILSPPGGHGRFALNELFAKSLLFYTNIASDKNQGFDVNNDFRQIGIIKTPKKYNSYSIVTEALASACWVLAAENIVVDFPIDSLVYMSNGFRFRIVTNTGSAILAQALDNGTPIIGQVFNNGIGGGSFTTTAVTAPTMDKYSGDLIFISNKTAFTPTIDQSVSLRTIINF